MSGRGKQKICFYPEILYNTGTMPFHFFQLIPPSCCGIRKAVHFGNIRFHIQNRRAVQHIRIFNGQTCAVHIQQFYAAHTDPVGAMGGTGGIKTIFGTIGRKGRPDFGTPSAIQMKHKDNPDAFKAFQVSQCSFKILTFLKLNDSGNIGKFRLSGCFVTILTLTTDKCHRLHGITVILSGQCFHG